MVNSDKNTKPPKKRKYTYLIRKEEAHALEEQVQALRNQLAALQDSKDSASIRLAAAKNQHLREILHNQQLSLAVAHAMLFKHLTSQPENPLKTYIHLPKQWSSRRETLTTMKADKFKQCHAYLTARSRNLGMTKNHFAEDQYEDEDGNSMCNRFDVIHFRGAKSLKQVYDALVFFMFNIEITISETLGDITVRDDYGSVDDGAYISNQRLVSKHDSVTSEVNTVTFAQYFEGENQFECASCAILATDSIDEDDLHPCNALEFVRRDVTAAVVLTEEHRRNHKQATRSDGSCALDTEGDSENDEEELVVVMRRAAFMKIYNPSFEVPESALIDMNERITQWPKVMVQTIREVLDAQA